MPYIKVIDYDEAGDELKEIYDDLIQKRGKLAEVHKIQSLNPRSIVKHLDLYIELMFGRSPLKRYQREMLGVVVSAINQCEYCWNHHGTALRHFWKDQEKVDQLRKDFTLLDLSKKDLLLCHYAEALTRAPKNIREEQHINPMKEAGLGDREILDAALITGYFNFVNRTVLGLGVNLESHKGEGFKYD